MSGDGTCFVSAVWVSLGCDGSSRDVLPVFILWTCFFDADGKDLLRVHQITHSLCRCVSFLPYVLILFSNFPSFLYLHSGATLEYRPNLRKCSFSNKPVPNLSSKQV